MKEPEIASDYNEREVEAAYSVLIELGQILRPFAGEYVKCCQARPPFTAVRGTRAEFQMIV